MPLSRKTEPFDHQDWCFEIKWDGFRALAHVEGGACRLISRNGNVFKSFPALNLGLALECVARSAVLDGEIVCVDTNGTPQFKDLLFRHGEPRFYAFDLLECDDEDLRYLPFLDRKHRLRAIVPSDGERLLYCDHAEGLGRELFRLTCERDLEGIVAKRKFDPYLPDTTRWFKIRNPNYSQWIGREELFERERDSNPDRNIWESCVLACAELNEKHGETR